MSAKSRRGWGIALAGVAVALLLLWTWSCISGSREQTSPGYVDLGEIYAGSTVEFSARFLTREMIRVVLNQLKTDKKTHCEGFGGAVIGEKGPKRRGYSDGDNNSPMVAIMVMINLGIVRNNLVWYAVLQRASV